MALSSKEKHEIIFHLGWSAQTLIEGSTQFNSVVNDRVSFNNTDLERIARNLLKCINQVDEQLKDAQCRVSTSKVDNVTMNPEEIKWLRSEKKRLVRELSDHLDIPIQKSSSANVSVVV